MLNFHRLAVAIVVAIILPSSLYGQAETLKFAWPDGASAKVQVRQQGTRVREGKTRTWDMTADFTMNVKRTNDRIVVSRNDFSGWKGTFPPGFGGGEERFVDMVPTLIVKDDGEFVAIEGHETARKLMDAAVVQAGALSPIERNAFKSISSFTSIEVMAKSHWAKLVSVWLDVELNPALSYELRGQTPVPQLGDGLVELNGTVKFVKETPCEATKNDQRCSHLHSETKANEAQVAKLLESFFQRLSDNHPIVTAFDQQFKADIVVERTTMLPYQLKLTRIHSMSLKAKTVESGTEEISTTYTFNWVTTPGSDSSRAGDSTKSSAPDFSHVTSNEAVMKLVSEGKLAKMLLMPAELSGADRPENVVYVPPGVLESQKEITAEVMGLVKEGLAVKLSVVPEYKGNSMVPAKIHIKTSHAEKRGNLAGTIEIW